MGRPRRELNRVAPGLRSHPDVLELRWQICARASEWEGALEVAQVMTRSAPDRVSGWVNESVALYRLKHTQTAHDLLGGVVGRFPKDWVVPYNLACYCAQLGRLDDSEAWFEKAASIGHHAVRRVGIADPDLKPLWDHLNSKG